jgi:hypothetical protein
VLLVPVKLLVATIKELLTFPADAAEGLPEDGMVLLQDAAEPPSLPIWLQPAGKVEPVPMILKFWL